MIKVSPAATPTASTAEGDLDATALFKEAKRRERLRRGAAAGLLAMLVGGAALGYELSRGAGTKAVTTSARRGSAVVAPGQRAVGVVSGLAGYCALLANGRVRCWGLNNVTTGTGHDVTGLLGSGGTESFSTVPVEVAGITSAVQVASGPAGYCAVLRNGTVKCWGSNAAGTLGNGGSEQSSSVPVVVHGLTGAVEVVSDLHGYCARLRGGHVLCWGANNAIDPMHPGVRGNGGALGDGGHEAFSNIPVAVQGLSNAVGLASDGSGYCALLSSGGAKCWGTNGIGVSAAPFRGFSGLLGNGGNEWFSNVPVSVKGLTGAMSLVRISGPGYCALVSSGGVECWGDNQLGALGGGGSEAFSSVPVAVKGIRSAVALSDRCALLASGRVACWGSAVGGRLGNGTGNRASNGYSKVPVMVKGLTNATMLASDNGGYCALVGSGDAACWGDNMGGQLGSGSSVDYSNLPVAVAGVSGAAAIVGGSLGFCAVLKSGGVRCWGYAASGQLGNGVKAGNGASSSVPVAVRGLGR